jgi:hypothetical protein
MMAVGFAYPYQREVLVGSSRSSRRLLALWIVAAFAAIATGTALAQSNDYRIEPGIDRPGADVDVSASGSQEACAQRCRGDRRCIAFTFVLPTTIQGPEGRCWLKAAVPPSRQAACCVSGVSTAAGDDLLPPGPGSVEEP